MKYLCDPHIVPTVVPNDISQLEAAAENAALFADSLHVDFADGIFAANTTWGARGASLSEFDAEKIPSRIALEAHLMVADPWELGLQLARAGFVRIIAHREAFPDSDAAVAALAAWKAAGAKEAGIALLLDTPLSQLEGVAEHCDVILLMSIAKVGEQGQAFDEHALHRVEEVHALYPDIMVAVDGGVNEATVEELVRAGANRLSVGAAISRSDDPAATYNRIYERAMRGCKPVTIEMNM